MHSTMKRIVAGALALAGATVATAEAQAMPIQPLSPAASAATVEGGSIEQVYYYGYRRPLLRYGYGYRRPFLRRRFGYGYGFRRPFYGYRRPFYGYGYRRF